MRWLVDQMRREYDYVVVDTAPLVLVPDCRIIERWVDGFLIVVTAHRTSRKLLEETLHITEPAKLVGLVFNGDDRHLSRDSYSYYTSGRSGDRNGDGSWRRFWNRHDGRRQSAREA
jgi:Mrp family chromosome partitioning ATPase